MAGLTFAEEILLLLLDDETGKMESVHPTVMEMLMAGAAMMDLAMRGRVDCDLEKLFVTNEAPTGEPMLDLAFEDVRSVEESLHPRQWIQRLSERGLEFREISLKRLVERGILREEDKKFLWVFRARRYPAIDGRAQREVKLRIAGVLLSEDLPDPRDVALICLADSCRILRSIFSDHGMDSLRPRIDQVRKLDLIGREVSSIIEEIERTLAMAMARIPH